MKIGIIDYGSGNLHSVHHSVAHAAAMKTDMQVQTLSDTENLKNCDYIIVPGVGHFADCWAGLSEIDGMVEALREAVLEKAKPFPPEMGELRTLGWNSACAYFARNSVSESRSLWVVAVSCWPCSYLWSRSCAGLHSVPRAAPPSA